MKHIFIAAALALSINSHAATQDLDQLLNKIEADIQAQRLAKPVGNNALEGIDAFRAQAPFDFRITPLVYKFGESYVSLANKAIAKKNQNKAQGYLDIAWQVAALTPGLEEAQAANDKLNAGKTKTKAVKKGPTAAEIKQQKALAAAAAAEKKRLDNDRKKKAQADKNAKIAAAKKAEADKKAIQAAEKIRRLAATKAQNDQNKAASNLAKKQKLNQQLAAAKAEKSRLENLAKKSVSKPVNQKEEVATIEVNSAKETSASIASYPLIEEKISNRNRAISEDLIPICKAIIDNEASIVLHTSTKADYRWLTVRLTLCTRRLDPGFRLRHSFQETNTKEPFMTLHPYRGTALINEL
jgi:colicin import membrane protein